MAFFGALKYRPTAAFLARRSGVPQRRLEAAKNSPNLDTVPLLAEGAGRLPGTLRGAMMLAEGFAMRRLVAGAFFSLATLAVPAEEAIPDDGWTKEAIPNATPMEGDAPSAPPTVIWHPPTKVRSGVGGAASFEPDADVLATQPKPARKKPIRAQEAARRAAARQGDSLSGRLEPPVVTLAHVPEPAELAAQMADYFGQSIRWRRAKGPLSRVGYLSWSGRVSIAVHHFEVKAAAWPQANALVEADPQHQVAAAVCDGWAYVGPLLEVVRLADWLRRGKLRVELPHLGIADNWFFPSIAEDFESGRPVVVKPPTRIEAQRAKRQAARAEYEATLPLWAPERRQPLERSGR